MAQTTEQVLIEVQVNADEALKAVVEQRQAIEALKVANNQLRQSNQQLAQSQQVDTAAVQANNEAIALNEAQISNLNTQLRANQRIVQASTNETTGATGAYQRLSQQYSIAQQKAKDMAVAYGSNSVEAKAATEAAKRMSDQLKEVDDSVGQNQRNVGNYTSALDGLRERLAIIPTTGAQAAAGFGTIKESVVALGKQFLVLAMNPIVLILAGITAAAAALYSIFKDFKPVVDKIEQSFAAISAVGNVLKNSFLALLTGTKSLTETFGGLGSAMGEAANEAARLKKEEQDLQDTQEALEVSNKQAETQIQKLILQSKNRTLSEKERMALIQQADAIESKMFLEKQTRNNREIKAAEDMIALKGSITTSELERLRIEGVAYAKSLQDKYNLDDEYITTLKNGLIKREEINQQSIGMQEKAQNRFDALEVAAKEKADKAREANLKAVTEQQDKELKAIEFFNALKIAKQQKFEESKLIDPKIFALRQKYLTDNFNDEVALINKKVQFGKMATEEAELAGFNIRKKYQDESANLAKAWQDQTIAEAEKKKTAEDELVLAAAKRSQDQIKLRQDQAIAEEQIQKISNEQKVQGAKQLSQAIYQLAGKNSKVGKMAAAAGITIDAIEGGIAAVKGGIKAYGLPWGAILGGVQAAALAVSAGRAIKDVMAVNSGLPESGGGGASGSISTPQTSLGGSVVTRQLPQNMQSAVQSGTATALQNNPMQPVLVTSNLTEVQKTEVLVKSNNSL